MTIALIIIWVLNLIAAILYMIFSIDHQQRKWLVLLFIFVPVVGFMAWYIPQWILRITGNYHYDRDSLVKRYEISQAEVEPKVKKELDVVPIEDAIDICSNKEKRELLLDQLKKDIHSNYKVVLPASKDSDSETAHYVAAAKMEAYRKKHIDLMDMKEKIDKQPEDYNLKKEYIVMLREYIQSELLAVREAGVYKREFCNLVAASINNPNFYVEPDEYGYYIAYLVDLKEYDVAKKFWDLQNIKDRNETSYMKILNMYYDLGIEDEFYRCLEQLEGSDIDLSSEGIKTLRYWKEKRRNRE